MNYRPFQASANIFLSFKLSPEWWTKTSNICWSGVPARTSPFRNNRKWTYSACGMAGWLLTEFWTQSGFHLMNLILDWLPQSIKIKLINEIRLIQIQSSQQQPTQLRFNPAVGLNWIVVVVWFGNSLRQNILAEFKPTIQLIQPDETNYLILIDRQQSIHQLNQKLNLRQISLI